MTLRSPLIFAALLLAALCPTAAAQHKDYSDRGPEYSRLRDIRIDALKIDYTGTKPISVEGRLVEVSAYKIVSKEPVPFVEGGRGYNNVMKDLEMHYELLVGDDHRNFVHDKLIDVLREISNLPSADRDFSRVGLIGEKDGYLIFSGPVSMPNYVWFDGRIVVVRFLGLGDRRRDHAFDTETFWKEKIRFYRTGKKLTLSRVPKSFATDFLRRYATGDFVRPKK